MRYAIGIDFGGSKISGALFNEKLKVIKKNRRSTELNKGRETVLKNILEVINKLKTKKIVGIGISHPGFEQRNKKLTSLENLPPLMNFNLRSHLQKRLNTKLVMENDANCFALAEQRLGAAKGAKNVIGIILGTGLGAGIIINGQIYTGAKGAKPEPGYMVIDPCGIKSSRGVLGDFESWCSGRNIERHYKRFGGKMRNPDAKRIFQSKEKAARKVMKQTYEKLGVGLGNLVNIFNPDAIVLGGGVSNSPFYKEVHKEVRRIAYPPIAKNTKIIKNKLGDDSGVIGAAILVFEKN